MSKLSGSMAYCAPSYVNYETKTFEELKAFRKQINLSNIRQFQGNDEAFAYLIRMVDFLLEKLEEIARINQNED